VNRAHARARAPLREFVSARSGARARAPEKLLREICIFIGLLSGHADHYRGGKPRRTGPARAPLLYRPRKLPHCRFSAARIVIRFPRATSRRLLIRLLANSITTLVGLSRPRERADFLENLD